MLADFGLAKYAMDQNTQGVGTPGFIAPEVEESGKYGAAADIWSFGKTLQSVFVKYLQDPTTFTEHRLLQKMTDQDPDKRPPPRKIYKTALEILNSGQAGAVAAAVDLVRRNEDLISSLKTQIQLLELKNEEEAEKIKATFMRLRIVEDRY